ncbi:hypothetical protein H0O02_03315, partial [Candidatus Micrarchaeota archaeon]|nr:hypothetical protein [Candidatus Micrarchaeota archaeon]
IQAGARIVAIKESEDVLPGMDRERFLSIAKEVLLHIATKAGPETRVRAIEALANFEGSEVKKRLDVLVRNGDAGIKRIAEDSIAMIREREDLKEALNHERVFVGMYPYEGDPKRFFVSMVYDSVRLLMPAKGDRKITDSAESAAAIRQLVSLISSAPEWKNGVFGDDTVQAEILEADIQNALFHFIKRGENNGLRTEAAKALAANKDERAIAVFKKIVERKESGFELVGRYTIPKPVVQAKHSPPPVPGRKPTVC